MANGAADRARDLGQAYRRAGTERDARLVHQPVDRPRARLPARHVHLPVEQGHVEEGINLAAQHVDIVLGDLELDPIQARPLRIGRLAHRIGGAVDLLQRAQDVDIVLDPLGEGGDGDHAMRAEIIFGADVQIVGAPRPQVGIAAADRAIGAARLFVLDAAADRFGLGDVARRRPAERAAVGEAQLGAIAQVMVRRERGEQIGIAAPPHRLAGQHHAAADHRLVSVETDVIVAQPCDQPGRVAGVMQRQIGRPQPLDIAIVAGPFLIGGRTRIQPNLLPQAALGAVIVDPREGHGRPDRPIVRIDQIVGHHPAQAIGVDVQVARQIEPAELDTHRQAEAAVARLGIPGIIDAQVGQAFARGAFGDVGGAELVDRRKRRVGVADPRHARDAADRLAAILPVEEQLGGIGAHADIGLHVVVDRARIAPTHVEVRRVATPGERGNAAVGLLVPGVVAIARIDAVDLRPAAVRRACDDGAARVIVVLVHRRGFPQTIAEAEQRGADAVARLPFQLAAAARRAQPVGIAAVAMVARHRAPIPIARIGAGECLAAGVEVILHRLPPFGGIAGAALVARRQQDAELAVRAEAVGEHALGPAAPMLRAAADRVAPVGPAERLVAAIAVEHRVAALQVERAARHDIDDAADRAAILFGGEGLVDVGALRQLGRDDLQVDHPRSLAVVADRGEGDAVDRRLVEVGRNAADRHETRRIALVDRADAGQ